jgi:hypothetical protein
VLKVELEGGPLRLVDPDDDLPYTLASYRIHYAIPEGDMVPISKDLAEHMMRYTPHVFEGIDAPEPPGPAGIPAQPLAAPKAD